MQVTGTNFRWIFWVLTAFAGLCGVGIVFLLPETYVPYLLHLEAKKLRKETGDQRWHAAMDKKQEAGVKALLHRTVAKPFIMIAQEPMLAVITLYVSLSTFSTTRDPPPIRIGDLSPLSSFLLRPPSSLLHSSILY